MAAKREYFGSRTAVILSMAGSAIGLGNIWRFPYIVGEHGGAAFILIYILATVLISLPVFVAEVTIGRRSRLSAYGAMSALRPGKKTWKFAGILAIIIPMLICSYYSVIGGWSVDFFLRSCTGEFVRSEPDEVTSIFGFFISSTWAPVVMHLLFLGISCFIVGHGVKSGIEKFSKISIPVLFLLILGMAAYSISLPGAGAGVSYLLKPDFSQIDAKSCAYALGQSFYSLSLGMGAIITYGSYINSKEDIVGSGAGTSLADMTFALLAGFAIMPAVFAAGIEPGAGPGLIFQSIPYIFSSIGTELPVLSTIISIMFFSSIVVAAMTSCISLLEVGVSFLSEKFNIGRKAGCLLLFLLCGGLGVVCSLSFGPLSGITVADKNIFDMLDWFCSNVLLLALSLLVVVFVGFVMKKEDVREEITNGGQNARNTKFFPLIYFSIRWIAPLAILTIFVTNIIF